jgi:hypothetical protein
MSNTISPCNYLFGKETSAIFTRSHHSQEFINVSLETLMQINRLLISKKEALFLFDPTAFNNQCHLYALMVAQKKSDERFLHLILFLSYAFLTDSSLLGKVCDKASTEAAINCPTPKKAFYTFLKDPEGERTRAARVALVALFESDLKRVLSSEESELYKELHHVAEQNLQLLPTAGSGTLYTYPKLAGVAYMIDTIARDQLTLLFKIKVMTIQGTGSFTYCSIQEETLKPEAPVIVFEMIATDDKLTYIECRDIAKRCPSHSRRHPRTADRHKAEESCHFCTDKRVDITPFRGRILPILQEMDKMFYAMGADFILENQKPYLAFFSDESSFPILTRLFRESLPYIEKFALSQCKPLNMSVSHAYTDCKSYAFQSGLIIDASYEQHLRVRGLIL